MENKPKKKFYKKWWFWLIVIVIVVGVIGSSGKKDDAKPVDNTKPGTSDQAKKDKTYQIGDNIEVGKLAAVVSKCSEQKEFKSGNQFINNVTTEGNFVVIDAKITNNDTESRTIDSNMFKLIDDKNREFSVYSKAELMVILGDKYIFLNQVNPGMSVSGTFVYEIPADVTTYSLKIYPGIMFKTGNPQVVKLK